MSNEENKIEIVEREALPENIIAAFNGDSREYNALIALNNEKRAEIITSILTGKTPERFIRKREGRGGKVFDYVPKGYFEKALNMMFGINGWSTEVRNVLQREKKNKKGNTVIDVVVQLRLEYYINGEKYYKEQFGSAEAHEANPLGDSMKAATSDALKKCCSQLGIAGDVYGQSEEDLTGESQKEDRVVYNETLLSKRLDDLEGKMVTGELEEAEILKAYNWLQTTKLNNLIFRARTLLEQFRKNEGSN